MRNEFNYLSFLNEDFHPEKAKIIYNSLILEAKKRYDFRLYRKTPYNPQVSWRE